MSAEQGYSEGFEAGYATGYLDGLAAHDEPSGNNVLTNDEDAARGNNLMAQHS